MRSLATFVLFAFCVLLIDAVVTPPASAEAMTLSCAYDRYNPNGKKIGSGADQVTVDFDRQLWMLAGHSKILYRLYGFDDDTITLLKREGVPGTQIYDRIDRHDGTYQILHLSSNPVLYRDKEGTCVKEHLVPLPMKNFLIEDYRG